MLRLVALDSKPLGLLTHPRPSEEAVACLLWMESLLAQGVTFALPSIVDYEVRREALRRNSQFVPHSLSALSERILFLPLDDAHLLVAAQLWAQMRQAGQPLASPLALDVDCILVAQVRREVDNRNLTDDEWSIATSDIGDLNRLAPAAIWPEITLN